MAKLKPCPFCGWEAKRKTVNIPHKSEPWHYVVCGNPNCLVEPGTSAYAKPGSATGAWNRRVGDGDG